MAAPGTVTHVLEVAALVRAAAAAHAAAVATTAAAVPAHVDETEPAPPPA